jgi:ribosomal protein S27AE
MRNARECEKCGGAALYSILRGGWVCGRCGIVWYEGESVIEEQPKLIEKPQECTVETEMALLRKENLRLNGVLQEYKNYLYVCGLELSLIPIVDESDPVKAKKKKRERFRKMIIESAAEEK